MWKIYALRMRYTKLPQYQQTYCCVVETVYTLSQNHHNVGCVEDLGAWEVMRHPPHAHTQVSLTSIMGKLCESIIKK